MTSPPVDLDRLEELAKAVELKRLRATLNQYPPDASRPEYDDEWVVENPDDLEQLMSFEGNERGKVRAAYFGSLDPSTVRYLISLARRAQEAEMLLREVHDDPHASVTIGCLDRIRAFLEAK